MTPSRDDNRAGNVTDMSLHPSQLCVTIMLHYDGPSHTHSHIVRESVRKSAAGNFYLMDDTWRAI